MFIGLTGGIGSGKSLVANYFFSLGATVIDADQLAKQVIERGKPGFNEVLSVFGDEILKDGDIDRKLLGEIVFSDSKKLKVLEEIIHPKVQALVNDILKTNLENQILIYEIPLIVETNSADKFDLIITVEAELDKRKQRLRTRGLTAKEIEARISNQTITSARQKIADFVLENNGNEEELLRKVEAIWEKLNASRK